MCDKCQQSVELVIDFIVSHKNMRLNPKISQDVDLVRALSGLRRLRLVVTKFILLLQDENEVRLEPSDFTTYYCEYLLRSITCYFMEFLPSELIIQEIGQELAKKQFC